MDENADRDGDYWLMDFSATRTFHVIAALRSIQPGLTVNTYSVDFSFNASVKCFNRLRTPHRRAI